ncbi:Zinc finger, ZZ-type [Metarhizium album ARSEF 1941]|uniref:Zinc finger, ZZ-type n=1 Tax=Metarhizium album (strain ARSEF 1941) TaxID=1081103 RepID=A0A0B2WQE5_METAS|nr:Zinc finger, ZZ-type [Metarhizium album ARSEF 1941]KHN95717.1 Zinc finger, ZZ-type [Metarhizium album ARSEF 1941]
MEYAALSRSAVARVPYSNGSTDNISPHPPERRHNPQELLNIRSWDCVAMDPTSNPQVLFREQAEPGLYLVSPRNPNELCTHDIFIVHGLNGGPTRTWQHPDTNCIWFRDLLPQRLRSQETPCNARIWTYGYNASFSFSTETIYGHALTLLNRVKGIRKGYEPAGTQNNMDMPFSRGHSGEIGESLTDGAAGSGNKPFSPAQALVEASIQSRYNTIHSATEGIIFLGTPHRGSGAATLGQVAALVAGAAVPGWRVFNRGLLKGLEKDNDALFQTCNRFANICTDMRIHSFYETMPLGPRVIVEQNSAILSMSNEEVVYGLWANHRDLCKYRDADDQNWLPVLTSILDLVAVKTPGQGATGYHAGGQSYLPDTSYVHSYVAELPVHGPARPPQRDDGNAFRPRPHYTPQASTLPYPDDEYDENARRRVYGFRQIDGTTSYGGNIQPNPQYPPYQPRPSKTARVEALAPLPPVASSATYTQQKTSPQSEPRRDVAQRTASSSASSGPPGRRPYPVASSAHSREDFSMNRAFLPERSKTSSEPPISGVKAVPSPDTSTPSGSEGQAADAGQSDTSNDDVTKEVVVQCDACGNSVRCSQPHVECSECFDYDLCINCWQLDRISKQHKNNHRVTHILNSHIISPEDLNPPNDAVNPEHTPDGSRRNWSVHTVPKNSNDGSQGTSDWRVTHLHGHDSHARFLASAAPGHFAILVFLCLYISPSVSKDDLQTLQREGLGWLRISFGTLRNKKEFFHARHREDTFDSRSLEHDSLPQKLLKEYWYDVVRIPTAVQTLRIASDAIVSIPGHQATDVDCGLILQWSHVRCFEKSNDALVRIAVQHISEPLVRALDPDRPMRASEHSPTARAAPSATASTRGEESEELSVEDCIAALVKIRQEVHDAQQRDTRIQALQLRVEQEEEEKRQAILQALYLRGLLELGAGLAWS